MNNFIDDYLRSLVMSRYQFKRDENASSLQKLHRSAILKGDYDRAILLAARHKQEMENLCNDCEITVGADSRQRRHYFMAGIRFRFERRKFNLPRYF